MHRSHDSILVDSWSANKRIDDNDVDDAYNVLLETLRIVQFHKRQLSLIRNFIKVS